MKASIAHLQPCESDKKKTAAQFEVNGATKSLTMLSMRSACELRAIDWNQVAAFGLVAYSIDRRS
jgi:hypothetical protein